MLATTIVKAIYVCSSYAMPIVNYIKFVAYKADMEHLALIDGHS